MRKKTSRGSSPASFQLEIESIFSRKPDSSLKEYDFSSNHTEDKSLFEAILDDDNYSHQHPPPPLPLRAPKNPKNLHAKDKVAPQQ